jgi:hypothetical protein
MFNLAAAGESAHCFTVGIAQQSLLFHLSGLPLGRPSAFPSSSKVALPLRGERTFSLPSLNCCVSFQMLTPSARASPPPDHLRFRSLHHFNVTRQIS